MFTFKIKFEQKLAHILNAQRNHFFTIFKPDLFQTNTTISYGHFELPCDEKLNFELEEKKFRLLLKIEVCGRFCLENSTFSNKLNLFSSSSNFDFSSRGNSEWPY